MTVAIVGDIGGTHARFAVWRDNGLEQIEVLATADYSSPESALAAYLERAGLSLGAGSAVCLACAGPVSVGDFQFTITTGESTALPFARRYKSSGYC